MLVPYLRFVIKNIGDKPITHLEASAGFELTEKKEALGEGSSYVVSSSDPPLKPGYKKEVFFGSGTGYKGMGIILKRPAVTADLYFETAYGEQKHLIRSIPISTDIQE